MTDKSDHLIERAAALLRSANAGQVVEQPAPGTKAANARGPGATTDPTSAGLPRGEPGEQAKFVPPPRPVPNLSLPGGGVRSRAPALRGTSVADLRSSSKIAAVELARLERAGLMVARTGRTRTAEEYRIVMGRVLRALHEDFEGEPLPPSPGSANVLLVTSARPGEGKSFTALNLGGSIAQNAGESVLLVDVDAKNNSLTDQLGLTERPGFLDMTVDPSLAAEELIVPTDLANLSILPLGQRSRDNGDALVDPALESRRLTPPITRLAERFPRSLIILDAPPCLSTSDPHTLAPVVGQVLMVVEAERTQRSEIEAAIDLVRVCPNITTLLNKVRMNTNHTFGSYDYFGSYT